MYKRQDYVLKISNMDFVVGLMEELPVNADQKDIILGLIRTKMCIRDSVRTLPTFLESRHSSLYSMGVRCSSVPSRYAQPAA